MQDPNNAVGTQPDPGAQVTDKPRGYPHAVCIVAVCAVILALGSLVVAAWL